MARKREDNAVVAPLIGSGILGGGAYGSHRLNRFMEDLGISSKFELNPEALKALDDYTSLVPDPKNPSSFAYQYAQAANRAGGAQLFLGDPKKRKGWEWDINNPALRREIKKKFPDLAEPFSDIEKLLKNKNMSFLRAIPGYRELRSRIKALRMGVSGARTNFLPLDEFVQHALLRTDAKTPKHVADALAHVPEMARSPVESYVRLLGEVAPRVKTMDLADNTIEALLNYKNPTYKDHVGKVFESPGDYLNEMWTPKGHKKYKGVFDEYLEGVRGLEEGKNFFSSANPSKDVVDAFRHDIGLHLTPATKKHIVDAATGKVNWMPNNMLTELSQTVGNRARWEFDIGKNGLYKGIKIKTPGSLAKGIRSVQDIYDLSHGHLGLKALNAIATAKYTEAAKPYKLMSDIVRRAQVLRNGKLRAGLALGSLALGGMGAANIYRNHSAKKENRRLINRIKNWIEDQIDKI